MDEPSDDAIASKPTRTQPVHRGLGWLVAAVGVGILLAATGVVQWPASRRCRAIFCEPTHWQIACIGVAFLCAGLALVIPPRFKRLLRVNAGVLVVCFLAGVIGSLWSR